MNALSQAPPILQITTNSQQILKKHLKFSACALCLHITFNYILKFSKFNYSMIPIPRLYTVLRYSQLIYIINLRMEVIIDHRVRDTGRWGAGDGAASVSARRAFGVGLADASNGEASGGQSQRQLVARVRTRPHLSGNDASRSLRSLPHRPLPPPRLLCLLHFTTIQVYRVKK